MAGPHCPQDQEHHKVVAEASDGSIINPASNMKPMKFGKTLSHVVESRHIHKTEVYFKNVLCHLKMYSAETSY